MLKENNIWAILKRMEDLRILKNVYPEVVLSEDLKKLLKMQRKTLLV